MFHFIQYEIKQKICDKEKLDQVEDLLEASPSTLAKFFTSNWCSVIVMRCNTSDQYVCMKTSTVYKLYNSVCDQKWNL